MAINITIQEYKVADFISIDYGTEKVTMTFFNGKVSTGGPGWATSLEMNPEQAREIAKALLDMAELIQPVTGMAVPKSKRIIE